mmetsp:Transcript_11589/g.26994  ORF Transcript_11589/g.26994 Transcript_11589/m.26994 type:complete len:314 (-) Transcript_11589:64-1005(-)
MLEDALTSLLLLSLLGSSTLPQVAEKTANCLVRGRQLHCRLQILYGCCDITVSASHRTYSRLRSSKPSLGILLIDLGDDFIGGSEHHHPILLLLRCQRQVQVQRGEELPDVLLGWRGFFGEKSILNPQPFILNTFVGAIIVLPIRSKALDVSKHSCTFLIGFHSIFQSALFQQPVAFFLAACRPCQSLLNRTSAHLLDGRVLLSMEDGVLEKERQTVPEPHLRCILCVSEANRMSQWILQGSSGPLLHVYVDQPRPIACIIIAIIVETFACTHIEWSAAGPGSHIQHGLYIRVFQVQIFDDGHVVSIYLSLRF